METFVLPYEGVNGSCLLLHVWRESGAHFAYIVRGQTLDVPPQPQPRPQWDRVGGCQGTTSGPNGSATSNDAFLAEEVVGLIRSYAQSDRIGGFDYAKLDVLGEKLKLQAGAEHNAIAQVAYRQGL